MENVGFLAYFLNSIPEEFLFVVITALLVGRRDVLDFKNRGTLARAIITALITAAFTIALRKLTDQMLVISLVQLILFILCYRFILKLRWTEASLGFIANLLIYLPIELLGTTIAKMATGITLEQCYKNEILLVLISIPQKILQATLALVLSKLRVTRISG